MIKTKVIGRLPQNYGDFDPHKQGGYGKKQRCFLFACEWESKMEGNTYAPATLDTTTGVITPDTAHWKHCSGSYNDWLIDNGYKKVDAGNVKDGNSTQHEINAALAQGIADETLRAQNAENDRYTKSEVYNKAEVNGLITTPDQEFVTVTADNTWSAVDLNTLIDTAAGSDKQKSDTVYRVGNWDGSQFDDTVYSEYAWNGTDYVHLSTKTQIGEVFDISAYHATGGTLQTYTDLADALTGTNGGVPSTLQKGGMSIKFVSSDNSYVQFRLMKNQWSTTPSDWQGTDTTPIHNSHNTIESGGVESGIFSAHSRGMLLSEVKTKASGTGNIAKNATTVGMVLENSNTYILTLAQAASLSALYCYIMKNGETVKGITMTVGKNYIVSDIDADSVAFYSVSAGTANGEIELDVRNFTYGFEKIISSDIASRVLVSKILAYEGFSGTRAVDANIKRGQRFRLITKAYDSASGKITIYAKNGSDTVWTQTLDTVNNDIELCLDENITSIEYWINSTNVTAEGLFILAVSLNDGNIQFISNRIDALMRLDISEDVDYSGTITEASTRHSVNYDKGDKIRIAITSKDYSSGQFYVYLKDEGGNTVYSSNLGVNSVTDIVVPADLGTISWYVNSSNIVVAGIVNVSVYKLSSTDESGISDNFLFGPYKEVKVKGASGYVYKEIVNRACHEGDIFFIGIEKVTGYISTPIVYYFKDGNNTNIQTGSIPFSQEIKAPAGAESLVVRLYPNQTGIAQDISAVYYNIYVAEGIKANQYIYEDITPVYAPKEYYHVDNYLNDKVTRINSLLKDNYGYGDAFIFLTDTHWVRSNAKQSPSLIKYIRERTNITKLIGGGDFEDQGATEKGGYNMFRLLTDNFKENDTHVVIGNHEFLGSTTNSQIANLYNKVARHQDLYKGNILRWYYFYDDNFRGIRWIFLASYNEGESAATNGYSEEQKEWLVNVALNNVPSGYDIVCVAHGCCGIGQGPDNNNVFAWSSEKPIVDIFDEYKESNPDRHILNIRGHVHRDRIAYTDGGITFIFTTCDKNTPWPTEAQREDPSSPYYNWYPDLNVDRVSGTIHEQAFDVMILNTHTHTLTAVRIGGKARDGVDNNAGDEVEERTVSY